MEEYRVYNNRGDEVGRIEPKPPGCMESGCLPIAIAAGAGVLSLVSYMELLAQGMMGVIAFLTVVVTIWVPIIIYGNYLGRREEGIDGGLFGTVIRLLTVGACAEAITGFFVALFMGQFSILIVLGFFIEGAILAIPPALIMGLIADGMRDDKS